MSRVPALLAAVVASVVFARAARGDELEHPARSTDAPARSTDAPARSTDAPARADDDPELFSCAKPSAKFSVNLKPDVELKDLVTWAMGFSCKKFLYGSALAARTAKITMITPGAMSAPQAWDLFEVALHGMGLTIVAKGSVLEIVESPTAKDEALAIRDAFPDGGTDVVRLLLRPEHADVADLAAALELVRSKNGVVSPLPKSHALLVTDDADHIARMRTMIAELDRPAASDSIFAIPLVHADATSVVTTINKLLDTSASATGAAAGGSGASGASGSGTPAARMRIVADTRSNALFVAGTVADYARVKALAGAIDVDTGTDSGAHLFRLKHAKAKDLATTLNALMTGGSAGGTGTSASSAGAAAAAARAAADSGSNSFSPTSVVRITADEASNSLLVMASAHDAASLRALVDDLDAPLQQVYIEALVLEVDADATQKIGVSWHGGHVARTGNVTFGGLIGNGLSSADPKDSVPATGFFGGTLGSLLPSAATTLLGQTIPSYGVLAAASASDQRVDVLASPHILTVDNHQAKVSVGENVPYQTSTGAATTGGALVGATTARQPVALSLSITPHISPAPPEAAGTSRQVALDIDLEDSTIDDAQTGSLNPIWKERSLVTSVVLHDEETLVLGGLVDDSTSDQVDKIPFLGDIPFLGRLFKQTVKEHKKSNLLVLLTPHVIDSSEQGRELLERRMQERDEFLQSSEDLAQRVWERETPPEKMRGLVADIDANVRAVERERAEIAAAAQPRGVTPGPIEVPATTTTTTTDGTSGATGAPSNTTGAPSSATGAPSKP